MTDYFIKRLIWCQTKINQQFKWLTGCSGYKALPWNFIGSLISLQRQRWQRKEGACIWNTFYYIDTNAEFVKCFFFKKSEKTNKTHNIDFSPLLEACMMPSGTMKVSPKVGVFQVAPSWGTLGSTSKAHGVFIRMGLLSTGGWATKDNSNSLWYLKVSWAIIFLLSFLFN